MHIWSKCKDWIVNEKVLLDNGANVDAADNFGGTALMSAASWDQNSTLEAMVKRGDTS